MTNPLESAVSIVGSQSKLAAHLGVTQPTIHHWLYKTDGRVPAEYCPKIEEATGGAVTREQLRPDIFNSPSTKPRRRK